MLNELEAIIDELRYYVKEYTKGVENSSKSKYPIEKQMATYYQGKLDAFTHTLIKVEILHKRITLEQEELLQDMCNRFDNKNEVLK